MNFADTYLKGMRGFEWLSAIFLASGAMAWFCKEQGIDPPERNWAMLVAGLLAAWFYSRVPKEGKVIAAQIAAEEAAQDPSEDATEAVQGRNYSTETIPPATDPLPTAEEVEAARKAIYAGEAVLRRARIL